MKRTNITHSFTTLILALMMIVGAASASIAANYYVAIAGNDTNSGTLSAPFKTVQKGLSVVKAGDTCWIGEGAYNEALTLQTSGTSAARITVKNYNGGAVTINSGNSRAIKLNGTIGYYTFDTITFVSNYVGAYVGNKDFSLDFGMGSSWWGYGSPIDGNMGNNGNNGFIVQNCTITGSLAFMGSNNIVQDCNINGVSSTGTFSNAIHDMTITSHDNTYRNNSIHDYTARGIWSMSNTYNITVSGNTIYDIGSKGTSSQGCGIDFDGAYLPVSTSNMSRNTIYSVGIGTQFENGLNCIADSNVVHNAYTGLSAINYGTDYAYQEFRNINTNNIFKNNVVYNTTSSGIITMSSPGNYIYNNTIDHNTSGFAGILLANQATSFNSNNNVVINNILTNNNRALVVEGSATGIIAKYNLYYGNASNGYSSANSIYANPLYVNSGSFNFNIQSTSPAINAGNTIAEIMYDIEGTPRPQGSAYDIGAFEFNTLTSPVVQLPSPTRLTVQ